MNICQARAEKEIRDLGAVKEKLEAEWELVKFMGQVSLENAYNFNDCDCDW